MNEIAKPLARYAAYRRAGDYIFLSGIIAVDPARKLIVQGFDDIPPQAAAAIGATGEFSTDFKQGPILAQSWYVLERVRQTVEAAGGGMADVVKLVQYFTNLDHFPLYSKVRGMFFPGEAPVSTVVGVAALMPSAAVLVEVEATVYLPLVIAARR